MADLSPSFGWIMQPAYFNSPEGIEPWNEQVATNLIADNERHIGIAAAAGFDSVWVEDHTNWQNKAHLECFTNMAWLAGRHPGLRYGTVVCAQPFRNPALLAKMATNMHVLTGGKFVLGIGAGNDNVEDRRYGFQFLPPGERIQQTEEAVEIIRRLWTEIPATFNGKYYSIDAAVSSPLPARKIPLMIGGMGEKKLLRLAARQADWWCGDVTTVEVFSHKVRVLHDHCAAVGRDPGEITLAQPLWVSVEDRSEWATRFDWIHMVAGDPDEVTRELEAFRAAGVQHFMLRFIDHPNSAGMERFISKVLPRLV